MSTPVRTGDIDNLIQEAIDIRVKRRLSSFKENLRTAVRVPPSYDNPLGNLSPAIEYGIKKMEEEAQVGFLMEETNNVLAKLFKFLSED